MALRSGSGSAGVLVGGSGPKAAEPAKNDAPVVLELFISQSCSSCPPAEALLADISRQRRDVLALEFHVDYWDGLVYGGSAWKDVFSDPAFTERQRRYAQRIKSSVYTPQMVIDGRREAVGSRRGDVLAAVAGVQRQRQDAVAIALRRDDEGLTVTLGGTAAPADV